MEIPFEGGDSFLLCSDGLTGMMSDEEISSILASEGSPESRVRTLVDLANDRGGVDNITVLLVDILPRGASQLTIDTAPTRAVPVEPEDSM